MLPSKGTCRSTTVLEVDRKSGFQRSGSKAICNYSGKRGQKHIQRIVLMAHGTSRGGRHGNAKVLQRPTCSAKAAPDLMIPWNFVNKSDALRDIVIFRGPS